jgi:membrane protease YdiL (CAAX protease family)
MWREVQVRMNFKSISILLGGTLATEWAVGLIPFGRLPIPDYMKGIAYHLISGILWVLLIRVAFQNSLARLLIKRDKSILIGVGIVLVLSVGSVSGIDYKNTSILDICIGFIFSLFSGIDEELFSRGLIFAAFEFKGVLFATLLSSVHFGLLHFGNVLWGGQSFAYTSGQIVSAVSFGFLACGLLLFTGSIWIPILLHGLNDFSMQFQTQTQFTQQVTGSTDWSGVAIVVTLNLLVGLTLIYFSSPQSFQRLEVFAAKLGLVE